MTQETMDKRYIGLSIGPIYETIQEVRTTRELWAASYVFSHLVKKISQHLLQKNATFLTPHVTLNDAYIGAGLYADRLLFSVPSTLSFAEVVAVVQLEVDDFAMKVRELMFEVKAQFPKKAKNLDISFDEAAIKAQFQAFFKVYLVEPKDIGAANPTQILSEYLDTAELHPQYQAAAGRNYLLELLAVLKESSKIASKVTNGLFNEDTPIKSLAELATADLKNKAAETKTAYINILDRWQKAEHRQGMKANETLMEMLKAHPLTNEAFRTHHKYVAIIEADGDSVGSGLKALQNISGGFEQFSEVLYDLNSKAVKTINEFGGLSVYAGGDDLLFFAPVFSKDKTVFHLLEDLNRLFHQRFELVYQQWRTAHPGEIDELKIPSLSFGVSIAFYKHPMSESIEVANDLLNDKAKKYPLSAAKKDKKKNALSMRILKHSGHYFEHTFYLNEAKEAGKENEAYRLFSLLDLLLRY